MAGPGIARSSEDASARAPSFCYVATAVHGDTSRSTEQHATNPPDGDRPIAKVLCTTALHQHNGHAAAQFVAQESKWRALAHSGMYLRSALRMRSVLTGR